MSLTQMAFDRDWTNPVDFPTHETQETKVREDIQYLFNSIRDQFNNFISNEFVAANMSFAPTPDNIEQTNVQDAIEYVFSQIQEAYSGSIPDGAVTESKIHTGAVSTSKIADGAVTEDKIADGAVTGDKIAANAISGESFAPNSIPAGKLGSQAVGTDNLANNCVTSGKLANKAVTTARLDDLAVTTDKIGDEQVTEAKLASALSTKINGKQGQHKKGTCSLSSGSSTWSNVTVNGITATDLTSVSDLVIGPAEDDNSFNNWTNCGIRCIGIPSNGKLNFKARSNTAAAVTVNVIILN